jgi:P4 family phage/plasmid primase-like protien
LSDNIKTEINNIYLELKEKMLNMQRIEQELTTSHNRGGGGGSGGSSGGNDEDDESVASYEKYIVDDRNTPANTEQLSSALKDKMYTKHQIEKSSELILFLSKPANKKTVIEDLSQKCYDEDFYKKLDDNHNIFVCLNGVLDLEQCIFRDGQPSDMMSISSGVMFPKNTDTHDAQEIMCAIQEWLDKIFPDDEIQAYVLNIFAYKLSGKSIGEKFHIFTGSGANGKSQFFKLIKETIGDNYQQCDNTLITTPRKDPNGPSPALAQLKSKRIIVLSEPKHDIPLQPSIIKEITGGDPLTCRHLNKDPIQFIPQFTLFLQCNDIPKNETTDDGFWRRVFIVPCESKFIIKEEDLYKLNDTNKYPNHFLGLDQSHMYKDWAPYFLYLLFERYKALKLNDFKYPLPSKITFATRKYQEEANIYTDFFNQKIEEAPGYKVDLITLYTEFQQFVGRDFKTIKSTFTTQMERVIGKPKGRTKEYHGFRIVGTTGELIEPVDSNEAE